MTLTMFHILVAVADRERHGYAIMQDVASRTDGKLRLGPGTLYGTIKRMLHDGLIEEILAFAAVWALVCRGAVIGLRNIKVRDRVRRAPGRSAAVGRAGGFLSDIDGRAAARRATRRRDDYEPVVRIGGAATEMMPAFSRGAAAECSHGREPVEFHRAKWESPGGATEYTRGGSVAVRGYIHCDAIETHGLHRGLYSGATPRLVYFNSASFFEPRQGIMCPFTRTR